MNQKVIVPVLFLLFILPFTFADMYQVNTSSTIYTDNLSPITYIAITGANFTLYNSTGTKLFNNVAMKSIGAGAYAYNLTLNQTGQYYIQYTLFNSTATQFKSDQINIVNNINSISQDTTNMLQTIFQSFLIFLVPFLLAVLAQYTGTEYLFLFSGTWFLGSAADMAMTGVSWATWSFFTLLGLFMLYHGISLIIERNERNKKAKEQNPEFESETN